MKDFGRWGLVIRLTLIIINVIFFIFGIALLVVACIFKSGASLKDLFKIDKLDELIRVGSISSVSTILIVLSVFVITLSILGIIGVKLMNKPLMIATSIAFGLVFLIHLISLIVVSAAFPKIKKEFRRAFNDTIEDLNKNGTTPEDFEKNCQLSLDLSEAFKCCGANGPSDFTQAWLVEDCCDKDNDYKDGCTDKVLKFIKGLTNGADLIPSVVLLIFEILSIFLTVILLKIRNKYEQF